MTIFIHDNIRIDNVVSSKCFTGEQRFKQETQFFVTSDVYQTVIIQLLLLIALAVR